LPSRSIGYFQLSSWPWRAFRGGLLANCAVLLREIAIQSRLFVLFAGNSGEGGRFRNDMAGNPSWADSSIAARILRFKALLTGLAGRAPSARNVKWSATEICQIHLSVPPTCRSRTGQCRGSSDLLAGSEKTFHRAFKDFVVIPSSKEGSIP
jgi:hypothetical protein